MTKPQSEIKSSNLKYTKNNLNLYQDKMKNKLNVLFERNDYKGVIKLSKKLISEFPENSTLYLLIGISYLNLNDYKLSIKNFKKSIELKPDHPDTYNNFGVALLNSKQFDLAIENFQKAIEIRNFYPEAYNNLGHTYQLLNDFENASINFEIAIKQNPKYSNALSNLGTLMSNFKKNGLQYHKQAVKNDPDNKLYWFRLALTLRDNRPKTYSDEIANLFLELFEKKLVLDPIDLIHSALGMIKSHSIFSIKLDKLKIDDPELELNVCQSLSKIDLLLKIMKTSPICDFDLEKLFIKLRKTLLLNSNKINKKSNLLNFQIALASQCFINEYIYPETDEEKIYISNIEKKLSSSINNSDINVFTIAALASYRPLNNYDLFLNNSFEKDLNVIYEEQIENIREEKMIEKTIKNFTHISDPVSLEVKSQYEENPYPRWVKCSSPFPFKNLLEMKNNLNLKVRLSDRKEAKEFKILVAGCGTGKQVVNTARRFPHSKITAIDLSKSSISFAKRKAKELNINNIDFMIGDILELKSSKEKFDFIECCGVLHHLENPEKGFKILSEMLNKNGLMLIALYSEHARFNVNIARKVIKKAKLEDTREDILKFRNYIIETNDELLNPLRYRVINDNTIHINDFYSLSEFRDLVFHKKETQFNLSQISKIIDKFKMEFIGFEIDNYILEDFIKINGIENLYSLDKWDIYEKENPNTFIGMYQFWLQK